MSFALRCSFGPGLFFRRVVSLWPLPLSLPLSCLSCLSSGLCRLCWFVRAVFGCFLGCDPAIVAFRDDTLILCAAPARCFLISSPLPGCSQLDLLGSVVLRPRLPPVPLICQETGAWVALHATPWKAPSPLFPFSLQRVENRYFSSLLCPLVRGLTDFSLAHLPALG